MTDPVDTDALDRLGELRRMADADGRKIVSLIAERDALRAELDAWEPAWRHMRDERDQLRVSNAALQATIKDIQLRSERRAEAIEYAPHDSGCQFSFLPEDKPRRCTCWKADVL